MLLDAGPFVLLDDARSTGDGARLYRDAVRVVSTSDTALVGGVLNEVRAAAAAGLHAAGFLAYAAAPAFESRAPAGTANLPLAWFGLFERVERIEGDALAALLPDPAGALAGQPVPAITAGEHARKVAQVLALIAAGDIYQANLSFRARVPVAGHPLALYAALRGRGGAGWGGVVRTDRDWLLSCSPEQFFAVAGDRVTARPMKGTAPRAADLVVDAAAAQALVDDPKQRAENLMIVDLMRNDLSRVAVAGSVAVPALFEIERYPTVHQMVSTVTATLAPGRDAIDVLAALFPCGSITGAPKLRAMEAIAAIESAPPRGIYTGAIGHVAAGGDAAFNVAIRTLHWHDGDTAATIGLGSAIVADSRADDEWRECLAKGAFVTAGARTVDLLETMRFDPLAGIALLDRHLARLSASALALGMAFDRHALRNELHAATFRLRAPARVRVLVSRSGKLAIEVAPPPAAATAPLRVAVVPLPVAAHDFRLRHKTSDRGFYDAARRAADTDEVIFVRPDGWLTEGSYTSLFVARGDRLATPPLSRALLPGVLRAELLATGQAEEADLRAVDLADGFQVGNALRGLMAAVLVPVADGAAATL